MTDSQTQSKAEHLTKENFDQKLEQAGDQPVMVDFFAEWCGPCKLAAPVIDELSGEYAGKAQVYKVDVDEQQEIAQRYGVMSIPTVIVFKDGEKLDTKIGFPGKAGYVQMLDKALA